MDTQPVVFISHTTRDNRDSRLAHRLADGLKERGAGVWIAPDDIPAGDEWQEDRLSELRGRPRSELLELIAQPALFAPPILTLDRVAADVEEICAEWGWL